MIDKNKLIQEVKNNRFIVKGIRNGKTCFNDVLREYIKIIIEIIENQPDIDKETAKKPDYEGDGYDDNGEIIYDTWICPNCGKRYEVDYDDYDYCPNCGQKLDWEE